MNKVAHARIVGMPDRWKIGLWACAGLDITFFFRCDAWGHSHAWSGKRVPRSKKEVGDD